MRTRVGIVAALAAALATAGLAAGDSAISSVSISEPFFNPTLGQKATVHLMVARSGSLSILILDRDGYPIRKLVSNQPVEAETVWYQWDGRDEAGHIVADEAYSLKVDLVAGGASSSYFPAKEPPTEVQVEIKGYDRRTGVLSYRLSAPGRVHAQAGVSRIDPIAKSRSGPVLKTIANREPRPGGAVIENWDGFDESGSFYLPDLKDFAVAVAATTLPENSIIAVGNSSQSFLETVSRRQGQTLLTVPAASNHMHHRGLEALDDASPGLKAIPSNASWSGSDRLWTVSGPRVDGQLFLDGPTKARFARQPGQLEIFLDEKRMRTVLSPIDGSPFSVSLEGLSPGSHILAFNWSSDYGPVAVSSLKIHIDREAGDPVGLEHSRKGVGR